MPKINTTIFKEGDVIRKSDITSVADEIEAIDFDLDEDNLREEGLDRRVFDNHPWAPSSHSPVEIRDRVRLPRSFEWRLVDAADHMKNSFSSVHPEMQVPWNAERDSDVIIRCSFFIDSSGSDLDPSSVRHKLDNWEFGLHVTHPDQTSDASLILLAGYTEAGGIWPYARIGLSKAFQYASKMGGDRADAPGVLVSISTYETISDRSVCNAVFIMHTLGW